jgi:hypothetical protein
LIGEIEGEQVGGRLMKKGEAVELIKAKEYSVPFNVWEYTPLDRACIKMVIRETSQGNSPRP